MMKINNIAQSLAATRASKFPVGPIVYMESNTPTRHGMTAGYASPWIILGSANYKRITRSLDRVVRRNPYSRWLVK